MITRFLDRLIWRVLKYFLEIFHKKFILKKLIFVSQEPLIFRYLKEAF